MARTVKTYAEQLLDVQYAIAEIENGQQVARSETQAGKFEYEKPNLQTLYKREGKLRVLADREANNSNKIKVKRMLYL